MRIKEVVKFAYVAAKKFTDKKVDIPAHRSITAATERIWELLRPLLRDTSCGIGLK